MHSLESDSPVVCVETCSAQMVRRIAAMLELAPGMFRDGEPLPRGWHFPVLGGETKRSDLRTDGFPGLGVPMPDLGLPRLLLLSREARFEGDLLIGGRVERVSSVAPAVIRDKADGRRAIVTISHSLRPLSVDRPVVTETQTYVLLPQGASRVQTH